jgi:ribosomal protein S18 acetylase RimI-like enzyme
MAIGIEIRPLRAEDRAAWEPLWQGYLTFYEASLSDEVTQTTWTRLLDPAEPVRGLGAHLSGSLVGIAHLVYHRTTWSIEDRCYLNDLFTAPEARGRGVARALIEAVYRDASAAGAERVYWLTHESNATAQALYDKVASRTGFIQYKHLLAH